MVYNLILNDKPFQQIKHNKKTIEMRLNYKERSKINIGDSICFEHKDSKEKLYAKVEKVYRYKTFEELYQSVLKEKLGYELNEVANPDDMLEYYSKEKINQYGVLGIEISLFDSEKAFNIYNSI